MTLRRVNVGPRQLNVLWTVVLQKHIAVKHPRSMRSLWHLSVPTLGRLSQTQRKWLTPNVLGFARFFDLVIEHLHPLEIFFGPVSSSVEPSDLFQRGVRTYLVYLYSYTQGSLKTQAILSHKFAKWLPHFYRVQYSSCRQRRGFVHLFVAFVNSSFSSKGKNLASPCRHPRCKAGSTLGKYLSYRFILLNPCIILSIYKSR